MRKTPYPAADLRLVRRLARAYIRACNREESADDLATSQRLALASDRVARQLAAARDGVTLPAPRTKRNLAIGAFAALATIGKVIARAVTRQASLRRAQLAAAARRAAGKVTALARASLRRAVLAVTALVVAMPRVAAAHPGHPEHDVPAAINAGGVVVVGAVLVGLAAHAWANWGPKRRPAPAPEGSAPDGDPPPDDAAPVAARSIARRFFVEGATFTRSHTPTQGAR